MKSKKEGPWGGKLREGEGRGMDGMSRDESASLSYLIVFRVRIADTLADA